MIPSGVDRYSQCLAASVVDISINTSSKQYAIVTFVGTRFGIMLFRIRLVLHSVLRGTGSGAKAGIRVLGHVLVGLLGSLRATALDGLLDVVRGVLLGYSQFQAFQTVNATVATTSVP